MIEQKSSQINKATRFSIKQKDYTIPMLLNQNQNKIKINQNNYSIKSSLNNYTVIIIIMIMTMLCLKKRRKRLIASDCFKLNPCKHKISLIFKNQFYSSSMMPITIVIYIAIIFASVNTNYCFCDKSQVSSTSSSSSSSYSLPIKSTITSATSTSGQHNSDHSKLINQIDYHNNNDDKKNFKIIINSPSKINKPKLIDKNQRANLMTVLSENIERQHFMMKPINVLTNKKSSKFDSGDGSLSIMNDDPLSLSSSTVAISSNNQFKNKKENVGSIMNNKEKQQQKFNSMDDNMNYILSLHQKGSQINPSQIINSNYKKSYLSTKSSPLNTYNNGIRQLKEKIRNPIKLTTTTTTNNLIVSNSPNKMISHLLSYMIPIVSNSKLLNNQTTNKSIVDIGEEQTIINNSNEYEKNSDTKYINSFINHPFVARSINNHFLSDTINKKQYRFLKERKQQQKQNSSINFFTIPPSSDSSEKFKSFLIKPPGYRFFNSRLTNENDQQLKTTTPKYTTTTTTTIDPQQSLIDSPSLSSDLSKNLESNNSYQLFPLKETTTTTNGGRSSGTRSSTLLWSPWSSSGSKLPNKMAHNYIQDSFRGLLTLTQLPILPGGQISTAPSILEKNKFKQINNTSNNINNVNRTKNTFFYSLLSEEQRRRALDELYRYAYILGTGVRRKRDPLKALASTTLKNQLIRPRLYNFIGKSSTSQRIINNNKLQSNNNNNGNNKEISLIKGLKTLLASIDNNVIDNSMTSKAKPRGVMWDMATDPSLAVTVFHLLERASVALPLGFLLMPFVQMIRNPFSGINLGRILPARASHRSVDYEELAKRLDVVDKMLSRALKSAHRES